MDLWILILPIKLIHSIPRPPREKVAIFIMFGLGIVSTIASIIRLQALRIFTLSNDPFYDSLPINTWSMVEVNIALMCTSIPSLKPLVSKVTSHRTRRDVYKIAGRKRDSSEWDDSDGKIALLRTGKDLLISLHPSTFKADKSKSVDEEWELDDRPPVPPPKDEKFGAFQQAAEYRKVITYPDMALQRI
jgi:hypothetical protein